MNESTNGFHPPGPCQLSDRPPRSRSPLNSSPRLSSEGMKRINSKRDIVRRLGIKSSDGRAWRDR